MQPNPTLRKLGFADTDRVILIHTDDIGMCQASVTAFADLSAFGLISCGAAMVPCGWFPSAAAYCRAHPEADMGVHIDLTCEWSAYRWGPLSTREPSAGLMDDEGYFYRSSAEVWAHADAAAGQREIAAQIERALAAGVDVSHIDTHMNTVAHPKFMASYVGLALKYRIPAMILRIDEAGWRGMGLDAEAAAQAVAMIHQMEEAGVPLIDHIVGMPLDRPAGRIAQVKAVFSELPAGITHFVIHPCPDTPEIRAIAPDWPSRVADYQAFMSDELCDYIRGSGIQVIGYRALRALMRGA
jgi:chitin disaccharide deacetylase